MISDGRKVSLLCAVVRDGQEGVFGLCGGMDGRKVSLLCAVVRDGQESVLALCSGKGWAEKCPCFVQW